MSVVINPIGVDFAAEIIGLDIGSPIDDATRDEVVATLDKYAVVVIRGERVSEQAQIDFALNFGPLDAINGVLTTDIKRRVRAELTDISNMDEDHALLDLSDRRRLFNLGNQLWHTDSSFKRVAAMYSMLHAHSVTPERGETQVCDLRAAYDSLDDEMKARIEDIVAVHSIYTSRAILGFEDFTDEERRALPPIRRPLVRVLPGSKRKTLFLASHAGGILGRPTAEARLLIRELMEHAAQPQFVYTHNWQVGDLLVWDNRCTMHRARPFDEAKYERDMRRATVMEADAGDVHIEP
ncbi:MAG: TauD/TfdA family dioxygenase [Rhodospirillaceae bacterium]|nr:TauD/TfdA family dioxygenase [Rhodospirillaceae bacterium]